MRLTSRQEEDTAAIARAIARAVRGGDVVLLRGELGAGKTTFVRAFAHALGLDARQVSSPTFVIAAEHALAGGLRLVHIDAYRLHGDESELELLGWDRLLGNDTITIIEWADRIEHLVEVPALRITLEHAGPTQREIEIELPEAWQDRAAGLTALDRKPTVCPITGEPVAPDNPHYPFSSERAKWADLYRWFSESYQLDRPAEQTDFEENP